MSIHRKFLPLRHLEGSAGIAGFIKSVHILQKGKVPPNLHFRSLNPHIDLDGFPAVIPQTHVSVPSEDMVSGPPRLKRIRPQLRNDTANTERVVLCFCFFSLVYFWASLDG